MQGKRKDKTIKFSVTYIWSFIRKNLHIFLLVFILGIGFFFRTYQLKERMNYAHDGDLYSWIVKDIGLISSFLQAVLIAPIYFDRRVVPSTPTNLWVVWFFYTIVMLSRGNYSVLPLLALLLAAVWHIHIALLPTLIAIPMAVIFSRKLPTKKQMIQ